MKSVTIGSVEPNPTTAPDPTATPAPAQSLKTPSISAAVLSGTTGVKLTWKKVTGAQKYYVYRSTDGKKWKKVKTTGSKALKLTWKKVANAQKYEIYRYDKKKWVKVKTVSANTLSYTDKNKKKGTTYKYRIRAYSTKAAPDKYSAYSATKSVKR